MTVRKPKIAKKQPATKGKSTRKAPVKKGAVSKPPVEVEKGVGVVNVNLYKQTRQPRKPKLGLGVPEKEEKKSSAPIITIAPTIAPAFSPYFTNPVQQGYPTMQQQLEQKAAGQVKTGNTIEQRGVAENAAYDAAHKSFETTGLNKLDTIHDAIDELRAKLQTYGLHTQGSKPKQEEKKQEEDDITASGRKPRSKKPTEEGYPVNKDGYIELIQKYNTNLKDKKQKIKGYSKLSLDELKGMTERMNLLQPSL